MKGRDDYPVKIALLGPRAVVLRGNIQMRPGDTGYCARRVFRLFSKHEVSAACLYRMDCQRAFHAGSVDKTGFHHYWVNHLQ